MTNEEARNVIEKYLKCRNEPCNDVRLCSECGLNTNESEQDEAFKLAIEALKCMSLNADMIKADAMHKLFITGEMTMEDFRKMCGKGLKHKCDLISRQSAIDAVSEGCQEWRGIFEECKEKLLLLPSIEPEIIRCEDCMHNGSFDTDCPIGWNGKEYCSFAERRTDE